jgi:hypothetical protein
MSIETFADLRGWFRERLEAALGDRGVAAQEATRAYLVDLLARVGLGKENAALNRPLALQLVEARNAEGDGERFRLYRALGDDALYLRGFCAEHLDHRGITTDYVATLGEAAYDQAGELALGGSEVYRELSRKFEPFADALDDVREGTALRTPSEIVRLYDRWTRTRSPKIAERLSAEGVFPTLTPKAVH